MAFVKWENGLLLYREHLIRFCWWSSKIGGSAPVQLSAFCVCEQSQNWQISQVLVSLFRPHQAVNSKIAVTFVRRCGPGDI